MKNRIFMLAVTMLMTMAPMKSAKAATVHAGTFLVSYPMPADVDGWQYCSLRTALLAVEEDVMSYNGMHCIAWHERNRHDHHAARNIYIV